MIISVQVRLQGNPQLRPRPMQQNPLVPGADAKHRAGLLRGQAVKVSQKYNSPEMSWQIVNLLQEEVTHLLREHVPLRASFPLLEFMDPVPGPFVTQW
jgi:hypothetical protein